jgi:hypothetical protein
MSPKQADAAGDRMIVDADRYGHPLIFRPGKLQRIEDHDRASVLSADKYGHVHEGRNPSGSRAQLLFAIRDNAVMGEGPISERTVSIGRLEPTSSS